MRDTLLLGGGVRVVEHCMHGGRGQGTGGRGGKAEEPRRRFGASPASAECARVSLAPVRGPRCPPRGFPPSVPCGSPRRPFHALGRCVNTLMYCAHALEVGRIICENSGWSRPRSPGQIPST